MLAILLLIIAWLALSGRLATYASFVSSANSAATNASNSGAPYMSPAAQTAAISGSSTFSPFLPDPYAAPGTNQGGVNTFNEPLPGDSTFNWLYKQFGLPGIQYNAAPIP